MHQKDQDFMESAIAERYMWLGAVQELGLKLIYFFFLKKKGYFGSICNGLP